jgi:hypothetical protein
MFNMATLALAILSSSAYATVLSAGVNKHTNNTDAASQLRCNPLNCNCLPPGTDTTVLTGGDFAKKQACTSRDLDRRCLRFDNASTCRDFCSQDVRNCRK